jgi:hypothetical protein
VSTIPTRFKDFHILIGGADIFGVMTAHKPPTEDNVRKEITEILDKITDSETLPLDVQENCEARRGTTTRTN